MNVTLISGATGHVGRRVAEILVERGRSVRLMARNIDRLPSWPHTERVQADYSDCATLDVAFRGVQQAFIISGYAQPGARAELHRSAFEAAARAGVDFIVYLSFMGASPHSKFPMSRDHYESEQYLRATGIPPTILRDSFYMDLIPEMFGADGVMRGPAGRGVVSWVAGDDVARVLASALETGPQASGTYDVTGPEALTLEQTAQRMSAIAGWELRYEEETLDRGRKWRSTFGAAQWEVDTWLGSYEAIGVGEVAGVSDTVMRFTGRPPLDLTTYFEMRPQLLGGLRL